jgi:hypothetical protein
VAANKRNRQRAVDVMTVTVSNGSFIFPNMPLEKRYSVASIALVPLTARAVAVEYL